MMISFNRKALAYTVLCLFTISCTSLNAAYKKGRTQAPTNVSTFDGLKKAYSSKNFTSIMDFLKSKNISFPLIISSEEAVYPSSIKDEICININRDDYDLRFEKEDFIKTAVYIAFAQLANIYGQKNISTTGFWAGKDVINIVADAYANTYKNVPYKTINNILKQHWKDLNDKLGYDASALLRKAAKEGCFELATMALDTGKAADSSLDSAHCSASILAAGSKNDDIALAIIKAIGSKNARGASLVYDIMNSNESALSHAASAGNIKVIEYLKKIKWNKDQIKDAIKSIDTSKSSAADIKALLESF
jgi:hypothetical protein